MTKLSGPRLVLAICLALLIVAAACTNDESTATVTAGPTVTGNGVDGQSGNRTRPTPTVNPPVPTVQPVRTDTGDTMSVSGKPVSAAAERGGTLIASVWHSEQTFSTWEDREGASFVMMHPLHNLLLQPRTWGDTDDFQRHSFLELYPDLALGWETSGDGLTLTVNIRNDVTWTDGTPLTCEDVAWTYNSIRTGRGLIRSPRSVYFASVGQVLCGDDYTVQFIFHEPQGAIIDALALPHNIIRPQHVYANDTAALRDRLPTVTTGPFIVSEHVPGESITYSRNSNYWDQPFPFLSGLQFVVLAESALAAGLRSGTIDVGKPSGYAYEEAETLERECENCQVWPRALAMGSTHHIIPNHTREPWNTTGLKKVIALAIDNTKYIRNVHSGWHFQPTGCGTYPFSTWAMPIDRCTDIPGYGDFSIKSSPAADKAQAREILANLGYSPGELSISILFSEATEQDVPAIISDFQEIGINAAAIILNQQDFLARVSEGNFDAAVHSEWAISDAPGLLLVGHFYTNGRDNFGRFSSPELDDLIDEMSAATDLTSRRELAWDALELALEQQAKIVISHGVLVPVYSERVRGVMPGLDFQAEHGPQLRYDHAWLAS